MIDAFLSGGIVMWPLLLIGLGILVLAVRAGLSIGRTARAAAAAEDPLQSILFWGVMALVLGLLGMVTGIVQIARAVGLAGAAEPVLLWGGFGVSLVSFLFGLLILTTALLLWAGLRGWRSWKLRAAS
jgi:hypothetical protein